jgi:hypothetical protein
MIRRICLLSVLASFAVAANASPATASVTLGQTATSPPNSQSTCSLCDLVQATLASGNSYVVPTNGGVTTWTLTSWSTFANDNGGMLEPKIYRPLGGNTYMAVSHAAPQPLSPDVLNTFTGLSLQVQAGDVLGDSTPPDAGGPGAIFDGVPGDQNLFRDALADGDSGPFDNDDPAHVVNISAVINPTNSFTLGTVTRNKKKGTATIAINDLPNPGDLIGSGNGAKVSSTRALNSKSVGAGSAQLLIKAKGKKKKKLNRKGKVKLNVAVTYTPTGGSSNTQSVKVKLKKKL